MAKQCSNFDVIVKGVAWDPVVATIASTRQPASLSDRQG